MKKRLAAALALGAVTSQALAGPLAPAGAPTGLDELMQTAREHFQPVPTEPPQLPAIPPPRTRSS